MTAAALYGALYLMEQLPLVAGLLLIIGIGTLIPNGKSIVLIVISD